MSNREWEDSEIAILHLTDHATGTPIFLEPKAHLYTACYKTCAEPGPLLG